MAKGTFYQVTLQKSRCLPGWLVTFEENCKFMLWHTSPQNRRSTGLHSTANLSWLRCIGGGIEGVHPVREDPNLPERTYPRQCQLMVVSEGTSMSTAIFWQIQRGKRARCGQCERVEPGLHDTWKTR